MKAIAIVGTSGTGKTTVCQTIISGLRKRGFSVGSVKEIDCKEFTIDTNPDVDTRKHKAAGSSLVTARARHETDILYQKKLPVEQILMHYNHDYVILEGVADCNVPIIITAQNAGQINDKKDCRAIAVSGVIAKTGIKEAEGLPVINALKEPDALTDFVLNHAFEPLPSFNAQCCFACSYGCRELAGLIAHKKAGRDDCVLTAPEIKLLINGRSIEMVPFVQSILKNAVTGVIKELSGYSGDSDIEIRFKT